MLHGSYVVQCSVVVRLSAVDIWCRWLWLVCMWLSFGLARCWLMSYGAVVVCWWFSICWHIVSWSAFVLQRVLAELFGIQAGFWCGAVVGGMSLYGVYIGWVDSGMCGGGSFGCVCFDSGVVRSVRHDCWWFSCGAPCWDLSWYGSALVCHWLILLRYLVMAQIWFSWGLIMVSCGVQGSPGGFRFVQVCYCCFLRVSGLH